MSTISAPPDRIDTILTIGAFFKRLLFAAPAEQVGTSGALVGLGYVLDISKASDALELLASACLDTAAYAPGSRCNHC